MLRNVPPAPDSASVFSQVQYCAISHLPSPLVFSPRCWLCCCSCTPCSGACYVPGTHSVVFVTCLNEHIARDIARAIMDRRLAACVNILPKRGANLGSGWGGFLTALLLRACFHFRSIHPFEIPDIISLPIEQGNPAYLRWMEESVPRH
uniref:Uncharacterized protein n=1 Tax=Junco hyemalis TaxID=40217 RepID=A0A8C5IIR2_JUNHY